MRKKIIILTGGEIRHQYFKIKLSSDVRFKTIRTYCEGEEKSLEQRIFSNKKSSELEKFHVQSRAQSELDFFLEYILQAKDSSKSKNIKKGAINDQKIVKEIQYSEKNHPLSLEFGYIHIFQTLHLLPLLPCSKN